MSEDLVDNEVLTEEKKAGRTLNFVLIGTVDHGKSSCSGRILVDTGTVSDRDVVHAKADAREKKMDGWWLSFLLDTDEGERLHGKTKDFIIVPIKTPESDNLNLNLIDVPGHKGLICHMISGASQADIAVLLCSASKGELQSGLNGQIFEHLAIVRGMGIQRLIVAVNKMDHPTVNWDMSIFEKCKEELEKLIKRLRFKLVSYVPISALEGTNVMALTTPKDYASDPGNKSLLSLIKETDPILIVRQPVKPQKNQKSVIADCLFIKVEGVFSIGSVVAIHTLDCSRPIFSTIEKIKDKPFIRAADMDKKEPITIKFCFDQEVDFLTSYNLIIRSHDSTIAIGKAKFK